MDRVWDKIKDLLKRGWDGLRYFMHRYQVIRWMILGVLTVILALSTWFTYQAKTADVQNIKASLQIKTPIYDRNDKLAGELYGQKGSYVSLDKISPNIQNAVISTEDRSFYSNPGFDIKGIARSFISLIVHRGEISGGGSTITQQLAKNTVLTQKQSFLRKGQEIFLAVQLNKVYSKEDILTMYLNNAYFGNGVWGVQDASRKYFGKNASEVSVGEGAVLAAMLRSPGFYNPIDHMDNAKSRRNLVLDLEVDNKKLTKEQASAAKKTAIVLKDTYGSGASQKYPSYFDAVIQEASNQYGIPADDLVNKGYRVYTNLDQNYQTAMQQSFANDWNFPGNAPDGTIVQGASIAVNPKNGGVMAVVGSRGPHVYLGFNYATQARRSPGSTLKPIMVYTTAIENGYSYDSDLTDKKLSYGANNYTPTNPTGVYKGTMPMYEALAQSTNAPAVWLMNKIGVKKGVAELEKFDIKLERKDQNLAAVLGGLSTGLAPIDLAHAYTAFANGGLLPETHFIRKIVDATGNTVVDNTKQQAKRVISQKTADEMTSMMIGVFNNGTGQSAKPAGYTIAGKTGTVELPADWGVTGGSDHWTVGYTPDVVVATWVGFPSTDKNHYTPTLEGSAAIFKAQMTNILPQTPQTAFATTDAQARAELNKPKDDGKNAWEKFVDGAGELYDRGKETVEKWYNGIKGWLGQ